MRSAACLHGDDSGVWRILAGDLFLRVEARGLAREIDEDVLPLCVVLENDFMCLAADAGLLVTAERRAFRNLVVRIDPDTACFDGAGNAERTVDVLCPDGAAEAVVAVVGHGDDFILGLEFDDNGHRTEDFLARDVHVVGGIGDERCLHEDAVFELTLCCAFTAAGNRCPLLLREFDIGEDLVELSLVDGCAELCVFFPRQANLDFIEAFDKLCYEFVVNPFLYENAGACTADLALIEENAKLGTVIGLFEVAVVKENVSRLAAKLKCCRALWLSLPRREYSRRNSGSVRLLEEYRRFSSHG